MPYVLALLLTAAAALGGCFGPSTPPGVDAAIDRGVAYLVGAQNKDGSWGSPAPNLFLDIYSPLPSSYPAYQVASSALAVSALVEVGDGRPGADEAVRRGADFLLAHHQVKRVATDTLYNIWSHAYAIEAFARLYDREKDAARRDAFKKGMTEAVALLQRYESADGGWGYYDDYHTQTPGHWTTSFSSATGLIALKTAKDRGVEVPEKLMARAAKVIEICRFPGNAFAYAIDHRYYPHGRINKIKGSLARTPACLLALDAWGKKCTDSAAATALENLEKEGHFLRIARKYPIPHEAWYQNSGYFCFYGYYYASHLVDLAPPSQRTTFRGQIAGHLVPLQEKDGSFWDYQLYGYHKAYGTGYVLLTLGKCRS